MPARQSKGKKLDFSQIALQVVEAVTKSDLSRLGKVKERNPAAVALGRLGASKGGIARAKKLSAAQRSEIAKKAAATRWKKGK